MYMSLASTCSSNNLKNFKVTLLVTSIRTEKCIAENAEKYGMITIMQGEVFLHSLSFL